MRAGKTFCLSLSFVLWSFAQCEEGEFALCGKTIASLRRNVVLPLLPHLEGLGIGCRLVLSQNLLTLVFGGKTQKFHLFGGRDEASAGLIQGVMLGGILFDEVALMPRSFVEQGLARCSVEGARFWFNCNPEHPGHWFYQEWILKADKKRALYLQFVMEDNPGLSPAVRSRYRRLYEGVFFRRFIEGVWTEAEGAVYPMFSPQIHQVCQLPEGLERWVVSCDYGTVNPTSMGLWGYSAREDRWYRVKEYYHCSRKSGVVLTDEEYCDALERLVAGREVEMVVVDPSAASFIQAIRKRGRLSVVAGNNRVLDGIRLVGSCLAGGKLGFHEDCREILREFGLYRWNLSAKEDLPIKENDHAMDELRYFVQYAFGERENGFWAVGVARKK